MPKPRKPLIRHQLLGIGLDKRLADLTVLIRIEILVRGIIKRSLEKDVMPLPLFEDITIKDKEPLKYRAWLEEMEANGLTDFLYHWTFGVDFKSSAFRVEMKYVGNPGFVFCMRQKFPDLETLNGFGYHCWGISQHDSMGWTQAADYLESKGIVRLAGILREFVSVSDI